MRVDMKFPAACGVAVALLLGAPTLPLAAEPQAATRTAIHIENFGKINQNYYRGGQPVGSDYADLAALGIRLVVDLQQDFDPSEARLVERAGMKFHRIPLTTSEAPTRPQVDEFLALVNDPANQPVFIHCQGGRHRTGVMTAAYRMTHDGWDATRAYEEMKDYKFNGPMDFVFGHTALKNFVFDYYAELSKASGSTGRLY